VNGAVVSVSGISSGAAMAVQFHVAHSSIVTGAGIIAGIPYWCANSDIVDALDSCTKHPELISVTELIVATNYAYAVGTIDNPALLVNSNVWLYSGTLDSVVNPGVMKKLLTYYQNFIRSSSIVSVWNVSSEHAFITSNFGNQCSFLGTPFINNCGLDAAGAILQQIYGQLSPRTTANPQSIQALAQKPFVPGGGMDVAAMADNAYTYIPQSCNSPNSGCRIHVAFHGCEQTLTDINSTFYMRTGYNEWAESNKVIVLYPQAKHTAVNPKGCWDWWGYTGTDYATKLGVQIAAVKNIIDFLVSKYGAGNTTLIPELALHKWR